MFRSGFWNHYYYLWMDWYTAVVTLLVGISEILLWNVEGRSFLEGWLDQIYPVSFVISLSFPSVWICTFLSMLSVWIYKGMVMFEGICYRFTGGMQFRMIIELQWFGVGEYSLSWNHLWVRHQNFMIIDFLS